MKLSLKLLATIPRKQQFTDLAVFTAIKLPEFYLNFAYVCTAHCLSLQVRETT